MFLGSGGDGMGFTLYNQLTVVQKAHKLVLDVYRETTKFPGREQYGLVSQIRRSAASIPTNICEGKGRESDKELARFLLIARGSLRELQYQLLLSKDLNYLEEGTHRALQKQAEEIDRMIGGMLASVKSHPRILRATRQPTRPKT